MFMHNSPLASSKPIEIDVDGISYAGSARPHASGNPNPHRAQANCRISAPGSSQSPRVAVVPVIAPGGEPPSGGAAEVASAAPLRASRSVRALASISLVQKWLCLEPVNIHRSSLHRS